MDLLDLQIKNRDDSLGREIYNSLLKNEACEPANEVKTNHVIEASSDSGDGEFLESTSKKPRGKAESVPYTCLVMALQSVTPYRTFHHQSVGSGRGERKCLSQSQAIYLPLFSSSEHRVNGEKKMNLQKKELIVFVLCSCIRKESHQMSQHRVKGGPSSRKGLNGGDHQRWMDEGGSTGAARTEGLSGDWLCASQSRLL